MGLRGKNLRRRLDQTRRGRIRMIGKIQTIARRDLVRIGARELRKQVEALLAQRAAG